MKKIFGITLLCIGCVYPLLVALLSLVWLSTGSNSLAGHHLARIASIPMFWVFSAMLLISGVTLLHMIHRTVKEG